MIFFVFMFIRVEKPCSHKYVVPNGNNFLTASSCAILKAFAAFDLKPFLEQHKAVLPRLNDKENQTHSLVLER